MIKLLRLIESGANKCLTTFRSSVYGSVKVQVLCKAFICIYQSHIVALRSVKKLKTLKE